jgi:hypothetical protein
MSARRPRRLGPLQRRRSRRAHGLVLTRADATLLDLVDNVLNKGVMVDGEVVLGVAGVDLVYLRLFAILCAVDKLFPRDLPKPASRATRPRGARGVAS